MALGQIESTVLVAVVTGFLIFTPERLILLRNFLIWAVPILTTWYGYDYLTSRRWGEKIVTAFTTGRGLRDIADLVWDEALSAFINQAAQISALVQQKCINVVSETFDWVRGLFGGTRDTPKRNQHGAPPNSHPFNTQPAQPSSTPNSTRAPPQPQPTTARPSPTFSHPKYFAILVTTPPIHDYGPISGNLYSTVDQPRGVPWASTDTSAIPSMTASLVFRRHFALCLVSAKAWESKETTLKEKLGGQMFWDHCGDGWNSPSSRGSTWLPARIAQINAVQPLGVVVADGDATEVCTSLYMKIRGVWGEYRNIWWNDADFALTLAYLLVDDTAASTCRGIIRRLAELRKTEVTDARAEAWNRTGLISMGAFAGAWILTAVTAGVALPVNGPVMIGSGGAALGSGVTGNHLRSAESMRWQRRRETCTELEERFPRLRQLFAWESQF